jgi:hypothetical protein
MILGGRSVEVVAASSDDASPPETKTKQNNDVRVRVNILYPNFPEI